MDTEGIEEVTSHDGAAHEVGFTAGVQACLNSPPGHQAVEGLVAIAKRFVSGIGQHVPVWSAVEVKQPVAILDGQTPEKRCVYKAEDRRVDADAKRQRQNCRSSKAGLFRKHAEGIDRIAPDIGSEMARRRSCADWL